MLWMFAVDGTAENPGAKVYPALICDVCDEPIHEQGLIAWEVPPLPADPETWQRRYQPIATHKGACIRAAEAKLGHLSAFDLGDTLRQMTYNFEHPLDEHDLAEWKRAQPTAGYRPDGPALR